MWLLLPAPALANVITVCESGCDHDSIQDAVDVATALDVVEVQEGTYQETLSIDSEVVIVGAGQTPVVTNPVGTGAPAVLYVHGAGDATVANIAFVGDQIRPIEVDGALLTVTLGFVLSNGVATNGGGLLASNAAVFLEGTLFDGNISSGFGGHIYAVDSIINATGCEFTDGFAIADGGAIYALDSRLFLSQSNFTSNGSATDGGAIAIEAVTAGAGELQVEGGTFADNTATSGGAIARAEEADHPDVDPDPPVIPFRLSNATFINNRGSNGATGGAVTCQFCDGIIDVNLFQENTGGLGAGLHLDESTFRIFHNTFVDNEARFDGGGAFLFSVDGDLRGNEFQGNLSKAAGGALSIQGDSDVSVTESIFCANDAIAKGGALAFPQTGQSLSRVLVTRSMFIENTAEVGGGVDGGTSLEVTLIGNHFLGNSASSGGAVVGSDQGPTLATDNVFAYNSGVAVEGDVRTEVHHNVFWANDSDMAPKVESHDNAFEDPLFEAYTVNRNCLDDLLYHAAGSPMHDGGTSGELDLDGSQRDIGFYGGLPFLLCDGPTPNEFFCAAWKDKDDDGTVRMYDCDDADPGIHPNAEDCAYDGLDANCDRKSDYDLDGDGFDALVPPDVDPACDADGDGQPETPRLGDVPEGSDCDDNDPEINPAAREKFYNTVDEDCSGDFDNDRDNDGFDGWQAGGPDCDDRNADAFPGAPDGNRGEDLDCDGVEDLTSGVRPRACAMTDRQPSTLLAWLGVTALSWLRRRPIRR